ncbi:predicted protein [Postia placenta Mad-698-R]|nr:predicted protein [Postia placenta Mad-698-R]
MFGEHESESPRVPSPWDHFLPNESSVNSAKQISRSVPKLVPEAEEGNVEYKLKLTNISPARFARLVTQLKWRLLEGGGQAYYELGVADSGALIGLSRADLEQSLETLEMMAGEIGASVIVVKEIEVPPAMYTLADDAARLLDPVTGGWTCKMKRRMVSPGAGGSGEEDATTTATETETDFTDGDFDDTPSVGTPADDPHVSQHNVRCQPFAHRVTSHPGRLSTQSSPFISPLDDDLALFSMEPEPPHILTSTAADDAPALVPAFSVDLEIASVYKPRPMRRRTHALPAATPAAVLHGKHARRQKYKEKEKKTQPWHTPPEGEGNIRWGGSARHSSGSADTSSLTHWPPGPHQHAVHGPAAHGPVNVGLVTNNWVKGHKTPYPHFSNWHRCRDVEKIWEWNEKHSVHLLWERLTRFGDEVDLEQSDGAIVS